MKTDLHDAARENDAVKVKKLVAQGIDMEAKDPNDVC